jgi:predicted ArsR family transcriptional regulator
MQKSRERIIRILKSRGQATVEELSQELGLTSVTVRHHLAILQEEGLVMPPILMRRPGPGRPQYIYRLSDAAASLFPNRYDLLATVLLRDMEASLNPAEIEQAAARIARHIADEANIPADAPPAERLEVTLRFLKAQGYMTSTELDEAGHLLLHVYHCPYERVARQHPTTCALDRHLISTLLDVEPLEVKTMSSGEQVCTYVLPEQRATGA